MSDEFGRGQSGMGVAADYHVDTRRLSCQPLIFGGAEVGKRNHNVRLRLQLRNEVPRCLVGVREVETLLSGLVLRRRYGEPEHCDPRSLEVVYLVGWQH